MLSYAEHGKFRAQTQVATHNFEPAARRSRPFAALLRRARRADLLSGSRDPNSRNGPPRPAAIGQASKVDERARKYSPWWVAAANQTCPRGRPIL